jgi:site-specific DNA-methyltransferase (adenine-specific)
MSNPKMFKYEWIWEKSHPTGFASAKYNPLKYHESILVFSSAPTVYNPQMTKGKRNHSMGKITKGGEIKSDSYINIKAVQSQQTDNKFPKTIQKFSNPRIKGQHPTAKPVALLEYLIKTYTNEGDTVLDNTMGSGTTGVACKQLNRSFIGIEMDSNYFDIASKRIANAHPSVSLFSECP